MRGGAFMDFARATVEAEGRERLEAKKRRRSEAEEAQARAEEPPAAGGLGAGGGGSDHDCPLQHRGVPPPRSAREAKARREARRRLEGGADATEEVDLARAEERGAGRWRLGGRRLGSSSESRL